jgi:membrane fusion protein, protease secretion system
MLNLFKSWRGKGIHPAEESVKIDAPAIPHPSSDTKASILIGIIILLVGVGGFVFWAITAPIDEGIPAQGVVSVEFKRKTVAHLTGGVVKSIHVQEGQVVKEGTPLITLDDTTTRASYESALQTYYSLKAAESRLIAEQSGASQVVFPADLTRAPVHPLAAQHMAAQRELFSARRAALASDLAVLEQSAESYEIQANGYDEQLSFMKQELAGLRELAAEGYSPRNQQLDLERQYSELASNAQHARRSAVETKLRAMQRRQEYRREVETQLADTRKDAANAAEHIKGLREELDRTIIRSPANGYVTGLAVHTIGGVVTSGMRLMDIVPSGENLIFEVRIPSHLVDRVHTGLLADINLHNFPNEPQLVVQGKVISVSADLITDPNPNVPPYYLSLVSVTSAGMKQLGTHQLQPGMPAEVLIKTGERTLLAYLMKPLLRRLNSALTEY